MNFIYSFLLIAFLASPAIAGVVQRIIYAGETPLASTCTASLTGPMQITIPACSFTTTGQARVMPMTDSNRAQLRDYLSKNMAEKHPDGRIRVWLQKKDGTIHERSRTVTLSVGTVLDIPTPVVNTLYQAGLGIKAGVGSVFLQSSIDGGNTWTPAPPMGWNFVHILIFPFLVPSGDFDLSDDPIEVFTVLPGFPAGTGPLEFKIQTGN